MPIPVGFECRLAILTSRFLYKSSQGILIPNQSKEKVRLTEFFVPNNDYKYYTVVKRN